MSMSNKIIGSIKAYPVLRKRFMGYIKGANSVQSGAAARRLFFDYLKVRRRNPEKRVSMSEYMIFGFDKLSTAEQKKFLTDTEATILMRPHNAASEPYLKDKVCFLKTFAPFISRDWLYLPEARPQQFRELLSKHEALALKPPQSSWGIGFQKLITAQVSDPDALFEELAEKGYLAEQFLESDERLAAYHPHSLNTLRIISFCNAERFTVLGAGLRVGNKGLHVDNAHGGGIFCEIDPDTGLIITDGLDECGNYYEAHPMTNVKFRGQKIPHWAQAIALCRRACAILPELHIVGWDLAVLPDGRIELIEGNHNPGMNIVQAPAKRGIYDKFTALIEDFYGPADG